MLRTKINHHLTTLRSPDSGALYRRFKLYFDAITQGHSIGVARSEPKEWYVPNPQLERELNGWATAGAEANVAVVGRTGTGKSTYLRFVFGTLQKPHMRDDGLLVIPFYLNGSNNRPVVDVVLATLKSAVEVLRRIDGPQITDKTLAEFIDTHKPQLLEYDDDLPDDAPLTTKLKSLKRKEPYAYHAERLKFLCQGRELVRSVVIVVDDLESSSFPAVRTLLQNVLKLETCLRNLGNEERTFSTRVMVACRPSTYRMFLRDESLLAYVTGREIRVERHATLAEIFQARFDSTIRSLGRFRTVDRFENADDKMAWERALLSLQQTCGALDERHGHVLVQLNNDNYRASLEDMLRLIRSKRIDRTRITDGAFDSADSLDFRPTQAGVLETLGLVDLNFYDGISTTTLPNLFNNFPDPHSDLILCLIAKYFLQYKGFVKDDIEPFPKADLMRDLISVLGSEYSVHIAALLDFASDRGLVEFTTNAKSEELVFPLPRLLALWTLLAKSSVYFGLCR